MDEEQAKQHQGGLKAMENKSGKMPWKSKTIWANFIVAASAFVPPVQEWIQGNPETFGLLVAVLNMALRNVTGEQVSWKVIDKKF